MTTLAAPAPVDHATPPAAVGAPARPPTYSDEPAVEAAVGSGLACLYPAGENYRTNVAMLADHADRSAALRADLDAFKAEVSPAPDPGDVECDPRDWPAWTDEEKWTTVAPAPAPRPRPFEPTPAERSWWAAECERPASPRSPRWPGLIPRGLAETIARSSPVGHDA